MVAVSDKPLRAENPHVARSLRSRWSTWLGRGSVTPKNRLHCSSASAKQAVPEPSQPITVRAGRESVIGNYRSENQDRCYCDVPHGVFLVVDGMGGHHGGARAAEIIVETVPRHLQLVLDSGCVDLPTMQTAVEQAVQIARQQMIEHAGNYPDFGRMGATMAVAVVVEDLLYFSHVGDCRVYHWRDGKLRRLTADQTFVQGMIDAGVLTEQAAKEHPWRHIVLNSVGIKKLDVAPVVTAVEMRPADRIVLASDGLTSAVEDDTLCQITGRYLHPQDASDALIEQALRNQSQDNVSCVVAELLNSDEQDFLLGELPARF